MNHNIEKVPNYESLLDKVENYLVDKVDQNTLYNIISNIRHKRENTIFNDDILFDVIKILTINNKISLKNIEYADKVYQMIKENYDYSFFLKILLYICDEDNYKVFCKLYNTFENKWYLIPILKKIDEIKKYQSQIKRSCLPYFDTDYYFLIGVSKYREYYIDDKTYLLAIMEVLNQYLKKDTYSGKYDYELEHINKRKIQEVREYDNFTLKELENNMNLVSNKINDTKDVIKNDIDDINKSTNKLDSEIDGFNNKLMENIKNKVDKVDYQSIIKSFEFNLYEQRNIVYDLTITELDKQKLKQKNEKVKQVFNKIKEYITTNNLCEENKEIEKVILNELNNMDYSKLKEQETIDYCILKYFAHSNDNLEFVPYDIEQYGLNNWLIALDKKVSSKFDKSIYKELVRYNFYIVKKYIENDMIDVLASLCNSDNIFVDGLFRYRFIDIPEMKKLIELFGIGRLKELNETIIRNISNLSEDQLEYYKSILDVSESSSISRRELLYPNQIFSAEETASLSFDKSDKLAGSLRLVSKSISDFENMPSVNIDKTKIRKPYKGIDYTNSIYIDELDPIYKNYLCYLIDNTSDLSYDTMPPFEFIFMYVNSHGDDINKFKEFIFNHKNYNYYNHGLNYYLNNYYRRMKKFLDKYNLDQMIIIEKNIDWNNFMMKTDVEQYSLLYEYQQNDLIKNKIIQRRRNSL